MTIYRNLVASFALAVLVAPSAFATPAEENEAIPEVCGATAPAITDQEVLVEHTLYFHGTNRLGDVQGGVNTPVGTPFIMDATAPSGTETKYKSSKPGVLGTDYYGRNAVNGYWVTEFEAPQRVVCAGSKFYAASAADSISLILYFDKPYSDSTVPAVSRVDATAPAGTGVRLYSGRFNVAKVAEADISIQFAPAPPGAVLAYDSTEAPSSFTYVTVEPKA